MAPSNDNNRTEIDRIWKSLDTLNANFKEMSEKLDSKFENVCDRVHEVKVQVTDTSAKVYEIAGNGKPGRIQEIINRQDKQEKAIEKLNNRWAKATGICVGVSAVVSVLAWIVEALLRHSDVIGSIAGH